MVNSLIQTHDLNDSQGQKPVIINGQQEQLSSATQATHQTDLQRPASNDPASINFLSKKGFCDIYLNGEQKLSLGISPIDGMAQTSIEVAKPGTYLLKITGWETWFEGLIENREGEEIKLKAEPDKVEQIGGTRR